MTSEEMKSKSVPKINWFFEPYNEESEEMMDSAGGPGEDFFDDASISLTKEGWIAITLSWQCAHVDYKHSAYYNGHISSGSEIDVRISFKGMMCPVHFSDGTVDLNREVTFRVGIQSTADDLSCLDYKFLFFDPFNRGGTLYFAPNDALMKGTDITHALEMHEALE